MCLQVLVWQCSHGYLWILISVCICVPSVCVCVSNTGLGSTLPPFPSGNWRTCFSVAVKPTQVGAPSAGLGGVSFPPVKDRLWYGHDSSSSAPLGGSAREQQSAMAQTSPACGLGFTQEEKSDVACFNAVNQTKANDVSRPSFSCKVAVCNIGRE